MLPSQLLVGDKRLVQLCPLPDLAKDASPSFVTKHPIHASISKLQDSSVIEVDCTVVALFKLFYSSVNFCIVLSPNYLLLLLICDITYITASVLIGCTDTSCEDNRMQHI